MAFENESKEYLGFFARCKAFYHTLWAGQPVKQFGKEWGSFLWDYVVKPFVLVPRLIVQFISAIAITIGLAFFVPVVIVKRVFSAGINAFKKNEEDK